MGSSFKGAIAGAMAGIAGTLAMDYAQRLWTRAADSRVPNSAARKHDARDWQEHSEDQTANELAAQAIATRTIHRPFTRPELSVAAAIMHFGFGAAVGALYGAHVDAHPDERHSGVQLGLALWLSADEIAMPLLRLSRPTTWRPAEMHLQSLVS